MSNSNEKSLSEIIDAYSPITRGKKGLWGLALKAIAKPLEIGRNIISAVARFPFHFGYENAAGQILTDCNATIPLTFQRMEKKLQKSFNTAARREASPIERETFIALAMDVRADAELLSKHCTILRTEFDNVTDKYNFTLFKEPLDNGGFKTTTLEQGVAAVKEHLNGQAAEELTGGAKNPVTVRRKPIEIQKPGQLPGL
ncbi:MAG: hypothetical protein EPN97_11765 [Alphaproteobacteria bacterium]|nr:MAG: hypothetical protein EPN97_11765 [Alphaproteobacteria bacterium]